ncbi:MAG: hypothetical protein OHK006_07820 [Thermodesulfovibrionales bacterium]
MTLRKKLFLALSGFFVLFSVFATGTILIFERLGDHMGALRQISTENRRINELENTMKDFTTATENWALTGDSRYRKKYKDSLSDLYKSFGNVSSLTKHQNEMEKIGREFQELLELSRFVITRESPVGDPAVDKALVTIRSFGDSIEKRIDALQEAEVKSVLDISIAGDDLRSRMVAYHVFLIVFVTLVSAFMIVRIRDMISVPVGEILKATEKVSRGDLSYRIGSTRRDEFGIVSQRFDAMVADLDESSLRLQRKLVETELLLDIARTAATTLDLRDALVFFVETITRKLRCDNCSIYMLDAEAKGFCLMASSETGENAEPVCIPASLPFVASTLVEGKNLVLDANAYGQDEALISGRYRSVLGVPIVRDGRTTGVIFVKKTGEASFSPDERNILAIISHTVASVVRNAELYLSTRRQLDKLSLLYELSRAVTSAESFQDLMKRIAQDMAQLMSSRGCIIRLLENGVLKIRSSYGRHAESEKEQDVALGEGVAGRVALRGEPLLIADVALDAPELRVPGINAKTVVCVPLKIGAEVIGTIGLYDKFDGMGQVVAFTADDMETLLGFASVSAIAIEREKNFEAEAQRQSRAVEEKKRLSVLFDSVHGGIITLDRNFVITSVNRFIEDWTGMTAEKLVGASCLEVFHDKIGICPHCAAKATFETGEVNSIMQSRGVNYADLTAYPIRGESGEINECVVFVMDITERVLYQEETLSLYREVIQTKEYLESVIANSADAIITTDLDGKVTSWNDAAVRIYGFDQNDVLGAYLPFVPAHLLDREREHLEIIRRGEALKDIETERVRKSGELFEVSLALSPIKDASGKVIGVSGISRDISEKKRVEKELLRRNEEISRLFFISSAMRGTLELDRLLRMVLAAVTMGYGMGFNRAILFLVDEEQRVVRGTMGVGPSSPEEAWSVWDDLSSRNKTLDDVMQEIALNPIPRDSFLDRLTVGIELPLDEDSVITRAVRERRMVNVPDVKQEPLSEPVLIQQLGTQAYAVVPLVSRDKVIGLIWVDNYFNRRPISDEDMQFLMSFSNHVASAIENARLFEKVTMAEQQLENIFESMSDMVYFVSSDYSIKSINRAVVQKIGLPHESIVGKKCYEIFHGMSEPYRKCPHRKTVETRKAYIEEMEDPHMGGTFLTSSSPIFDSGGEFMGSVHVVRDVTELKNLREKLSLAEKMAALGEVAAKVAHEIRNPLVSVGGFAKRLEKKLDGNLREYAGIIVKEVTRLEGILREILGFVKEVRLVREDVGVNTLVSDVIDVMGSEIAERGVTLVRDFGPDTHVFVDANRVKEAVMNILANAVQSLSGSGTVTVRTLAAGREAVIEIEDTGRGISEADLSNIFNPFFTTKSSGTGLGLAITHKIVQEHGGRIEVSSELEKGSTFRVFLPKKEE